MVIKVIFDKKSLKRELCTGWGGSFLIDDKVLFDTGENGIWLLENMRSLKVGIKKIEAVVISHDHWDHSGGLWELLKQRKGLKVYGCPGFSEEFKDRLKKTKTQLIEADRFIEVSKNIYLTGEIGSVYHGQYMPEQSLVLKTKKGLTVITGCSHPGILKICEKVKENFPGEDIYLVLGGFHLMQSDNRTIEFVAEQFKKIGIKKTGPTHCCGEEAEAVFKKHYGRDFVSVFVGQKIRL